MFICVDSFEHEKISSLFNVLIQSSELINEFFVLLSCQSISLSVSQQESYLSPLIICMSMCVRDVVLSLRVEVLLQTINYLSVCVSATSI